MSPALSPQMPFSAISTMSPRSTMLFMTQSIAAWPVADRANVTGFAVYIEHSSFLTYFSYHIILYTLLSK